MKQLLFFLPSIALIFLPSIALGAEGLVTCTGVETPGTDEIACGTCEFVSTLKRAFQFLITIASIVATIILVYVGLRLVTSGGNQEAKQKAKEALWNIVIGLLFIIAAFAIVDVVFRVLVPAGSSLLDWDRVQCIHAIVPVDTEAPLGPGPGAGAPRLAGSCTADTSGPCSAAALEDTFGSLAEQAAQIASAESGCNMTSQSGTDTTSDGRSYSMCTWQINLASNDLNCGGETLNCTDAFRDTGERNRYNVRIQEVVDEDLYQRCAAAVVQPDCCNAVAGQLAQRSGDMGDWACSAKKCGINTSRNDSCRADIF